MKKKAAGKGRAAKPKGKLADLAPRKNPKGGASNAFVSNPLSSPTAMGNLGFKVATPER